MIDPPVAGLKEKILSIHGHDRVDEFYWIRDDSREDPEVLALLAAENAYKTEKLAHTSQLQESLFREISMRLPTNDRSVPVRIGDFQYFREFKGGEYPIYKRTAVGEQTSPGNLGEEQILLDANELAKGHEFYEIGNWSVSFDNRLLAFVEDTVGRRINTLRFRDLDTGLFLPDEISEVSSSLAWAADNQSVFYVRKDPQTLLPFQVFRHRLGEDVDELVYEENDDAFYSRVYTSRTRKHIVISHSSTDSSEIQLLDANNPTATPVVFLPREPKHEYRIRHHIHPDTGGSFYILTNWQARNFRFMKVDEEKIGSKDHWQEVVPHREDVLLEDFEVFTDHFVILERENGLNNIRVVSISTGDGKSIRFEEPAYTARLHSNPELDAVKLRYSYSSLTTPDSILEFDLNTGVSALLKSDEVVGDFDKTNYRTERFFVTARDGIQVPVSLVYRKDKFKRGENPGYVYAYGSYGFSTNPSFHSRRLSLLDRGFVFAILHVRGGEEMGRAWYEDGKLLHKKNTFNDFIDGTRALGSRQYMNPEKIFAAGGSAGGLLMGVVANEAPELFLGIIAHVPFVDVVTTMLDESIPLTTGEFTEWGNPKDEEYYNYMLSYSPYDQVKAQSYPNMLVTTGLHDSQVQYFEPVKWVSRLRRMKTDDNLLLIDIDMNTGHGGASGRYERYKTDALEYAFILDLAGRG